MADASGGSDLVQVVTLLGAAVVAVPLFKRIGLGSRNACWATWRQGWRWGLSD